MNHDATELRAGFPTLALQPLLPVAVAFACGIVVDRYLGDLWTSFSVGDWWSAGIVATLIAVGCFVKGFLRSSLAAILFATFCLGGAAHNLQWNYVAADDLARYASDLDEPVCIEAIATEPSQWSPAAQATPLRAIPAEPRSEVEIEVTRLRNGRRWQQASGSVRLRVNGVLPDITTGDRLLVFARLGKPMPAMNPGQYDYAQAERTTGRHCELFTQSPACVSVIKHGRWWSIAPWRAVVSRACQKQVARYVSGPQQALTQALLLGVRGELNDDTMDAFMKTGTIHLIVVSGMHVALIALIVWFLVGLGPFSQAVRLGATILLVLIYAAIVGWEPSVIRSTVFVVISLVAVAGYQRVTIANGLALAAILVLAINPPELFRAGTQFSFLGVAAVVASATWLPRPDEHDPLERMIRSYYSWHKQFAEWLKRKFALVTIASVAAWIVLAPCVLYHFHVSSPSSIVLTPIAWLPMSLALMCGLAICTVGFLFAPLAWMLGHVCTACMAFAEWLIHSAVDMPASFFYSPGPGLWWILTFYGVLGFMAVVPAWHVSWKTLGTFTALWAAAGLGVASWRPHDSGELRCTMLAVGHGTCVVLELPTGETMLYDAGSLGSPESATNTIASYLWSRGITNIDAIVISHADVDHYNGVPGLLERFAVGKIYVSPLMFDPWATAGDLTAPNYLKEKLDQAGVPLEEVWMNDRLSVADERVNIEVLHPPRFGVPGRDNANSLLLAVEYLGHRILLPGDLESPGIEAVIAEEPLDVDVLLAPHHGSAYSDPPGFAAWCTPEWVVFSGRYSADETRLTTASYHATGAEILRTAQGGAMEFVVSSQGISCKQFLDR
jgi:competence protein ComEC